MIRNSAHPTPASPNLIFPGSLICWAVLIGLPQNAAAEQQPLWEAGVGVAYIDFPHYRGSDQRQSYLLPAPYLVYRGETLKYSRNNARGMLFKSEQVDMDISVNGSVPVRSKDNVARYGMPDIEPTLEVGPALNLHWWRSQDDKASLDVRLPLRAVLASDFSHVQHAGWLFQPQVNVDFKDVAGNSGWNLGLVAGLIFADKRYHHYFYNVDAAYANTQRPMYSAPGGYGGSQIIAALSKRFPRYFVTGFTKWDNLDGAAFENSPLVKSRRNFTMGAAIFWVLDESKTKVTESD